MKKILTAFTASLYILQVSAILILVFNTKHSILSVSMAGIMLASVLALVIIGIINIFNVIKIYRNGTDIDIKSVTRFKLIQIPFFIINYILWIVFMLMMLNPMMLAFIKIVPIGIAFTYCVMLSTSLYLVVYLHRAKDKEENRLSHNILHKLLQLMFIADVADCIYLNRKTNI